MPSIGHINERFVVINTGYKTTSGEETGLLVLEPGHTNVTQAPVTQTEFNGVVKGWVWKPANDSIGNPNGWWGTSFTREDPDGTGLETSFETNPADIGDFSAIRSDFKSDINIFPGKSGKVVFNDDAQQPADTSYRFPKTRASAGQVLADPNGDGVLEWVSVDSLDNLSDSNYISGTLPIASGDNSFAVGVDVLASGISSYSQGWNNRSSGDYSHSEGNTTWATGLASHSEGQQTRAEGNYSHAEGLNTNSFGNHSHAEGYLTTSNGESSHAEGNTTTSGGDYSHAEGNETAALGVSSHAEGDNTTASGNASHAEGLTTTASGIASSASGKDTVASGLASSASGIGSKASMDGQWAHGIKVGDNILQRSLYYFSGTFNTGISSGTTTKTLPDRLLIPHHSVWGVQVNIIIKDVVNKTSLYYTSGNKSLCVQCVDNSEDVLIYGYENVVSPGPDININITPNSTDDPNSPASTLNTLFNYNNHSTGTIRFGLEYDSTPSTPVQGFEQLKLSFLTSNLEDSASLNWGVEFSVLELNEI